jgi:hypothetical protein
MMREALNVSWYVLPGIFALDVLSYHPVDALQLQNPFALVARAIWLGSPFDYPLGVEPRAIDLSLVRDILGV